MSKTRTDGIERNHRCQHHWFGRFKRTSVIVSKPKDMWDLTVALFARFRVNGGVAEIFTTSPANPALRLTSRAISLTVPLIRQHRAGEACGS